MPPYRISIGKALLYAGGANILFNIAKNYHHYYTIDADYEEPSVLPPLPSPPQEYFPFSGTLEDIQDEKSCWEVVVAATTASNATKYVIQKDKFSGCGVFGSAYVACVGESTANCNFIGKRIIFSGYLARAGLNVSSLPGSFAREVYMAKKAGELGIGPRIHAAYYCNRRAQGIIIMDKVAVNEESCNVSWDGEIRYKLREKVLRMHENGILHQDLAARNVLIDRDDMPWIIDFGLALELGTPIPESLRAYDIASLYYELPTMGQQFDIRLTKVPKGELVAMMIQNTKLPWAAFQQDQAEYQDISSEAWLQATRMRYNHRAHESFWVWVDKPDLMQTLDYFYPDAVTYVRMVLASLGPTWRKYFQKQPPEILRDCFLYTLSRIGFKQARVVSKVLANYLRG